jgi:hypothetical protein
MMTAALWDSPAFYTAAFPVITSSRSAAVNVT